MAALLTVAADTAAVIAPIPPRNFRRDVIALSSLNSGDGSMARSAAKHFAGWGAWLRNDWSADESGL